jgi:hypothetical protein
LIIDFKIWDMGQPGSVKRLQLEPRKISTEANMRTRAEGDVFSTGSIYINMVGFRVNVRIHPKHRQHDKYDITGA